MDALRHNSVYFLDSMTSPKSVALEAARAAGVGAIRRDVFLDNNEEVSAIGAQLEKAAEKARQNGAAVAIGHPHPSTLEALKLWIPKAGVRVVPLDELIRRPEG